MYSPKLHSGGADVAPGENEFDTPALDSSRELGRSGAQ